MAKATMYSQKDKVFKQFPIKCEPSKEDCEKCPLKNNCDKKKWFDMIASGEKTEEYREIKPYWEKRLLDYDAIKRDYEMLMFRRFLVGKGVDPSAYPRGFTHVRFHRGYTKITMTFEIDSITFGNGKEEWGAEPGKMYFVIKLKRRSE